MSTPSSDPAASSDTGLPALERLRERIEAAVTEIERLRDENATLAARVRELAEDAVAGGDGEGLPTLTLEGDPEDLRSKVEAFIEAIDQMLAEPATPLGDTQPGESDGERSSESAG